MGISRESGRSEFKGNLQKSPATLRHPLPLDGTIYLQGFQPEKSGFHTVPGATHNHNLRSEPRGEGELDTQKPARLHGSQSTDLSQLPRPIQLHPIGSSAG